MSQPLPPPGSAGAPNFWMNETGGELQPAVRRYLEGQPLTIRQIVLIRAYFKQWILSPAWDANPHQTAAGAAQLAQLRKTVYQIGSREDIGKWLADAIDLGIDPL